MAPGQDPLAVGLGVGQDPRARAGGDQHHVGLEHADLAVLGGHPHPVMRHAGGVVDELTVTADDRHTVVEQLPADVGGLRRSQRLDPVVDVGQRDRCGVDADVVTQTRRAAKLGAHPGRGDQRLRRDAVVQHARPAQAVRIDDRHLDDVTSVGGRDQRRLVSRRSSSDDHDARYHATNLLHRPRGGRSDTAGVHNAFKLLGCRSTPLTDRTCIPTRCCNGLHTLRWPAPAGCTVGG